MKDKLVKINFAPSFYAELEKMSEEDKVEIYKIVAEMSDMTIEELMNDSRTRQLSDEEVEDLIDKGVLHFEEDEQ